MVMSFEEFCNGTIYDEDKLLNNSWPEFTECFQNTLLIWVPCGFLWITLPFNLYYSLKSDRPTLPLGCLNMSKTFFALILFFLEACMLLYEANLSKEGTKTSTARYVGGSLKAATFLLVALLLQVDRLQGFLTSGVIFIFWFLTTIAGVVPFYTQIIQEKYNEELFMFTLYYIYFGVVLLSLILSCFAERTQRRGYTEIGRKPCPETQASFLSRITFWWINKIVIVGYRKGLEEDDLWDLNPRDHSSRVLPQFQKAWQTEVQYKKKKKAQYDKSHRLPYHTPQSHLQHDFNEKTPLLQRNHDAKEYVKIKDQKDGKKEEKPQGPAPSLLKVLAKTYGPEIAVGWGCKVLYDLLQFVSPMILNVLIAYVETKNSPNGHDFEWKGYVFASSFFVVAVLQSCFFHQNFHICMTAGMRIKSALISAIYKKALTMDNGARKTSTVGEIVNLMSVDCQRIQDITGYLWMLWSAPLQIALALALLWNTLGPAVLAGLAIMILMMPVNALIAMKQRKLQVELMRYKDQRIKLMNEVLNGIKVLKLYAWEASFQQKVADIRNKELNVLKRNAYLNATSSFFWTTAPFLVTLGSFTMYIFTSETGYLDAQKAFVSLSLFNILKSPINLLPTIISYVVQVTLASFMTYILTSESHYLDAQKAFVSLSLFNILRFPINLLPMIVSYVVQVTLASFVTYVLTSESHYLDAQKAFVSLSLFNILRFPINMLPMLVSYVVQGQVSIGRIGRFLQSGDLDPNNVEHSTTSDYTIKIENGTFSWDPELRPALQDINLEIPDGKLVAVVGTVGSGKSSLISAFLGEMEKLQGRVSLKGRVAYVPQQAWIQNATVKDNILFSKTMDNRKYDKVIEACALAPDLDILPGGDLTEIGEKGINLSGGQKQRVSLARAVYTNADVYLLDDPLSAVDSHVGKHIFEKVVGSKGMLRNKTRVLVTHGVQWLPMVDTVVVMMDGKISECGTYEELLSHDGAFAQFLKTYLTQEEDEDDEDPEIQQIKSKILERVDTVTSGTEGTGVTSGDDDTVGKLRKRKSKKPEGGLQRTISKLERQDSIYEKDEKERAKKPGDKLIEVEKSETGKVSWKVYLKYFEAMGGIATIFIFLLFVVYQGAGIGTNIWLSAWTDDKYLKENVDKANTTEYQNKNYMYLGVYAAFGIGQAVVVLAYALLFAIRMVRAAGLLHNGMLANILKAPMAFFDTTPIGRIVNRFSRDVETVDNNLPQTLRMWVNMFFAALSTLIVISYSTPIFLTVVVPIAILYYLIQRFYIPTSRQLKRIESTTRSPIYTHFSESITGASTIRAYGMSELFIDESRSRVDKNLIFYFSGIASNRWLGFRLEFIGNFIVLAAAMFAVVSTDTTGGLVGLSISYALQVTGALNFLVRMTSDLETNVVSVERVKEYTEVETEAQWILPFRRPPHTWPEAGNVTFDNYSTRYRAGLDLVLRGITCQIKGGERVGIVGRTGAGKSSLTVALFRLIESVGGGIIIDGQKISDMGLHDLRSKLTILPQDPVLFSGTLRMNLDPFDVYTDQQIWTALEHAHLKTFVTSLPDGLQHECGEGGQNLSVGQRQLVCLARTLLRKTKILILDEATAAVDMETDDLIQKTIREEFKDCTILTIAHRLNTIMDYDRLMVLDQGLIKEFDSPEALLKDKTTVFYGMAKDANLVS